VRFDEVLEAAAQLSLEDQEALIALLRRRSSGSRRAELAKGVKDAREEFQAGECQPRTPEELMKELLS
jgi:hypothetical protein